MEFNNCLNADSAETLFAYIDGTLAPAETQALERHAASCESCRKLIDGQRAMWSTLDEWEAPELTPDFNRNLHAAVAEESRRSFWSRLAEIAAAYLTPRNVLVPAGALAAVVMGVMLTRPVAPVVEQKAGLDEVKQIERTLDDLDVLTTLDTALASEEKL